MNLPSVFNPSSVRRNPDAIARRAYEIWNKDGRPDGCDLRHWLQAEQELSAESAQGSTATPDPLADALENGNGTRNGNGRSQDQSSTNSSARTASTSEEVTAQADRAAAKVEHAATADSLGKTTTRGTTPKRKAGGSGRGSAR